MKIQSGFCLSFRLGLLFMLVAASLNGQIAPTERWIKFQAEESRSNFKLGTTSLRGNVRAWAEDWFLRSVWGTYREQPEILQVGGGVRAIWRGDTLWAGEATVLPADSSVKLSSDVRMVRTDGSRLSSTIFTFSRMTGFGTLSGPVTITDSTETYEARSDTAWFFEETQTIHLARNCTLHIETSADEVLTVLSDTTIFESDTDRLTCLGDVIVHGVSVEGQCNRLVYDRSTDRVELEGNPSLRSGGFNSIAEKIILTGRDGVITQVVLERNAWAGQEDATRDSLQWDQAWGDRMVLWIHDRKPSAMLVTGASRAFHAVLDSAGIVMGTNSVTGDSIHLGFKTSELEELRISGSARGTYTAKAGGPELPGEIVEYEANTIRFNRSDGLLTLQDDASLNSGSLGLTASEVRFSLSSEEMVAIDDAVLKDGDQEITGNYMTFNTNRRQGLVGSGFTKFEQAFSFGRKVARVDKQSLNIRQGSFTSCDKEHPHFYITSPKIRVTLDDKIVCRPVVMWIHDIPVFGLPYWVFPIKKDRHSGILVPSFSFRNIVGLDQGAASIRDMGYYFVLGDYGDATLSLDWHETRGWTINALGRYALRYRINRGNVSTKFARRDGVTEWEYKHQHDQILPYDWRLKANIEATTSREFQENETWNIEDILDQQRGLKSNLTLSNKLGPWSVRVSLRRDQEWESTTEGDVETETETITTVLPEISLSHPSRRIIAPGSATVPWYQDIYASLSSSFRNRNTSTEGAEITERHTAGTIHNIQLRWQLPKILRRINVSPNASYRETWVHLGLEPDEEERMINERIGVLHSIGVSASTKLYGLLSYPIGPLVALRHVVTPSMSYSYTPDWFTYGWDFSKGSFENGDDDPFATAGFSTAFSKSRRLGMSLNNVFQAKFRRGDEIVKKDNLATAKFSTNYDLEKKKEGEDPWSNLTSSLQLSPARFFSWNMTVYHNPNESMEFISFSSNATLRLRGSWARPWVVDAGGSVLEPLKYSWNLTATHRLSHQRGATEDPQTLQVMAGINPTGGWQLRGSFNYDLESEKLMNRSISVSRDLHCWQMDFSWYRSETKWNYNFKIYVKAYPDALFIKHQESN